eukprot:scaffold31866_cov101-Isochrysis_galbana.AAC.3
MDTDGPVLTPLPSAKSGRPPPTLAKFSSSGPSTGLGAYYKKTRNSPSTAIKIQFGYKNTKIN